MTNKTTYYRQCELSCQTPTGVLRQTAWIPERLAIKHSVLRIISNGVTENGWVVRFVGHTRVTDQEYRQDGFGGEGGMITTLPDSHRAIRAHRRNTGDASYC